MSEPKFLAINVIVALEFISLKLHLNSDLSLSPQTEILIDIDWIVCTQNCYIYYHQYQISRWVVLEQQAYL